MLNSIVHGFINAVMAYSQHVSKPVFFATSPVWPVGEWPVITSVLVFNTLANSVSALN